MSFEEFVYLRSKIDLTMLSTLQHSDLRRLYEKYSDCHQELSKFLNEKKLSENDHAFFVGEVAFVAHVMSKISDALNGNLPQ